ncbi:MAG: hypothetical protein N3E52_01825 [Candidatus Bathyarchaeota archaeon]|nr:hypothetical protein [Candidatus Bathyarchaeota archaeon]
MKCRRCGEETFLPFQCPYCGDQFCTAHRLPEAHDCPRMDNARIKRWGDTSVIIQKPTSYEYSITYGAPRQARGRVHFSQKELKHIAIGTLLVIGISLSFSFDYIGTSSWFIAFSAVAAIITSSFLTHEIAHKITAQWRGLWAEFRLTRWGAILTFISILLPFKIISPGAVMIAGYAHMEEIGKISIAGPATNIVLSTLFLGLTFASVPYYWIFAIGAFFNGYIAVFNLIPVGLLDGYKIFLWNKKVWATAFIISLALAMMSYYAYYFY